jgi:hypothetical protein
MKKALSLFLLVTSTLLFGGSRDGAGRPISPPLPSEDFSYRCELVMVNPSSATPWWKSVGELLVTKEMIQATGPMGIAIPLDAWKVHGTFDPRDPKATLVPAQGLPPYNLEGHFLVFTFGHLNRNDPKSEMMVNLIATVIHKGSSWAYASFLSPVIGTNLDTAGIRLKVTCIKN